MRSLLGTVFASGVVEFYRDQNRWAFQAIRSGMKTSSGRVVLDPKKAPIELAVSEKVSESELPWLERLTLLLETADRVYLRPGNETLRLIQTVHDLKQNKQLITLGDQSSVDAFSAEHWQKIRYFYTKRFDGFRFDVRKMFSHRQGSPPSRTTIEIETRLAAAENEVDSELLFDATGSGAHNELIEWRKTIPEGEVGRFHPEDGQISLIVTQVHRPFTFWTEYREEFKSYAYEFVGDELNAALKKLPEKREEIFRKRELDEGEEGDSG